MLYEELEKICLPLIENYQTDLTVHDKDFIHANANVPFIHYTRDWGTHLVTMPGFESYPKAGERVPYLFGTVDREELVKKKLKEHKAIVKAFGDTIRKVLYYDGIGLLEVSLEEAEVLLSMYERSIRLKFILEGATE